MSDGQGATDSAATGVASNMTAGAGSAAPKGPRVLIIDDEPEIRRVIRTPLLAAGYAVEWAPTGQQGMELAARWRPDAIVLDLFLPDMDGVEVCRQIRAWSQTPIIVLSVRDREEDKVKALEEGADDYLTKPFGMQELTARIRVALRHAANAANAHPTPEARFQTGALLMDFERRLVTVDGVEAHLTPTEYEVLKYLATHAGRVVTHRTLLRAVWGPQYEQEAHYLRVFVGQIRRKIEPEPGRPQYILTEPGVGYRLRSPEDD